MSKKEIYESVRNSGIKWIDFIFDKIDDSGINNILSYIKSYWADDIYQYQISMSK